MVDFSKPDPSAGGADDPGRNYPPQAYPPAPPPQGYPPAPQPQGYPPAYPYPGQLVRPDGFPLLPPGVEPASHGRRIGAYFLSILLFIVTLGIGYLIWGAIVWGRGTSPALQVLGMRCVDANDGRRVGFGRMALRDIVGGIVQGIVGFVTGLVSFVLFLATAKRQSLADMIGSTVVVRDAQGILDR